MSSLVAMGMTMLLVPTVHAADTFGPRVDHRGAQLHSLWGSSSLEDARRELNRLESGGADTVRLDLSWSSLEQNGKGRYARWYLDKADAVFNAAAARGLKVVAVFSHDSVLGLRCPRRAQAELQRRMVEPQRAELPARERLALRGCRGLGRAPLGRPDGGARDLERAE